MLGDHDDLAFAGVAGQAELVRTGQVSARELTELVLARIEAIDPELNAFGAVYPERALAEADERDRRRRAGQEAPLLGVPVGVKDEMDLAGEVTSRGTGAVSERAPADGEVVRRLCAAGAVVVGKTTMPELGLWPFTESITWGATRNPWDTDRTPGGSSGGSAAAVAAGLVPAALAADGAGSIRIPAACSGLFGLKPQGGRVPRAPNDRDGSAWIVFRRPHPLRARHRPCARRRPRPAAGHPRPRRRDRAPAAPRAPHARAGPARRPHPRPRGRAPARARGALYERVAGFFTEHDALLTPVLSRPAVPVGLMEGRGATVSYLWATGWVPFNVLWNATGQPAASVPAGFTAEGLPLAVQLVGRADGEPTLLALSAQLEAARPWAQHRPALPVEVRPPVARFG